MIIRFEQGNLIHTNKFEQNIIERKGLVWKGTLTTKVSYTVVCAYDA